MLQDILWLAFVNAYVYLRHPLLTLFATRERPGLPNPACPHHVIDKFLWRKVFDRDPSSVAMSNKIAAKQIAVDLCPDIKAPRTLWVGERFEDIPPQLLAGDTVVKSTHGSGFFHIIRNGHYDREEMIARTRKWMRTDYSRYFGEWNYYGIDRRLFVEELLKHSDGRPASQEAKVYVFGETALCAFYFHDRLTDQARQSLYDDSGNAYDFDQYLDYPVAIEVAPSSLPRVIETASRLAAGRDHVRVDLYEIDGDLYFSEFTFYNRAGRFGRAIQKEFPHMTRLWDLRRTWFLNQPQPGWRGAYARWLKARLDRQASQTDG
ncbi:MAG: ATP-grasp fold amidoligase family protein [Anderseniella sp.]